MSDPQYLHCYLCGEPIEDEDEFAAVPENWDLYEFEVPCHRKCLPDDETMLTESGVAVRS